MTDQISLEPRISQLSGHDRGSKGLPLDLLEDSARRLRALCVVILTVVALNEFADLTFREALLPDRVRWREDLIVLAATALAFLSTFRLSPRRIIDAGLAYAVVLGFIFAWATVPFNWFLDPEHGYVWSPNAVWVLVFPIMIPGSMGRMLVAAGLAAAAEPVTALYLSLSGACAVLEGRAGLTADCSLPGLSEAATRLWPNVVAVIVALLVTRAIHKLGEKIQAARALGNYHLVRELGEGGMGQVWEATHRLLARPAAVKLISPDALGENPATAQKLFRRFEREAQATAQLQSPHTIGVYDFGVARDGTFYYVMELLDGLDLHSLVQEYGPQPAERVAYLLIQACHSLAEAHERGLIHRDIKPANIFLCRYGLETDFVKVLDFGLVKPRETEDEPRPDLRLTQQQVVTGTPGFIAPEALGDEKLDGRADLYALGCVAYWLLTGREVFEHATLMAMLMAHAQQQPRLPSETVSGIPPELEAVVMRLLAKEPGGRPQSAQALAVELKALHLAERWVPAKREAWWAQRPARTPPPQTSVPTVAIPN